MNRSDAELSKVMGVLKNYYRDFSTLDPNSVLPHFHEPALMVNPKGIFAATTHALLLAVMTATMDSFRARNFGRTELITKSVRSLDDTSVIVTGVAQRYKTDGQELDRAGVTYVMHKGDSGWRIAVVVLHDPEVIDIPVT